MTVLFTRSGYSPTGGAERYTRRLAGALQEQGHEIVLLANPEWPTEAWPGEKIVRLNERQPQEFANEVAESRIKFPDSILFALQQIPCADLFRAAGGVHASWLDRQSAEEGTLASWFRRKRRMHRQILKMERQQYQDNPHIHVITNSEMVAEEVVKYYAFPRERISVIHNGYNPGSITPEHRAECRQRIRQQFNIPDDAPLVVFLGSGFKRKGADVLAEAFRTLAHPNAHLILAGKGKLRGSIPPRAHLPGGVSNPQDYLLAADLFALPTLYDPFANACIEASAHGLPVLTTNANGFAEALAQFPKAGEAIPIPRTTSSWADALNRWLDPEKRAAATEDIRSLTAAFTLDNNVRKTAALLEELASRKS